MTKNELRKKYKALRSDLNTDQIEYLSLSMANKSLGLPIWNFSFYHLFLSITKQKEVNTEYLLNILQGKDKNVVISKSNFSNLSMTHYLLTDTTTIKKNKWHIPEPVGGINIATSQIDVVFVPLLAFDNKGNRVGYGKGFYDQFLNQCKQEVVKIGVSFFEAEEEITDTFEKDVRLNYCITPERLYQF